MFFCSLIHSFLTVHANTEVTWASSPHHLSSSRNLPRAYAVTGYSATLSAGGTISLGINNSPP